MDEPVLLRTGFPLRREENGVNSVTCQYLFLLFGAMGVEHGQAFDGAAGATFSEETDYLEMRGMMQLCHGGDPLVGSPIDDHAPVLVLLLNPLVEMLPDQNHQDAGRDEQEQGHQHIEHQNQHDRLGDAAESQSDQEHQDSFHQGSARDSDQVQHGHMPDYDTVDADQGECYQTANDARRIIAELQSRLKEGEDRQMPEQNIRRDNDQYRGQKRKEHIHPHHHGGAEVRVLHLLEGESHHSFSRCLTRILFSLKMRRGCGRWRPRQSR